jgi:hypothetical protein
VSGIAGAFASFFLDLGKNGDEGIFEAPADG